MRWERTILESLKHNPQQGDYKIMGNALGKLWQRFIDFINKLAGKRSMEALEQETMESYDQQQLRIQEGMTTSGGKIGVMKLQIAIAQESVDNQESQLRKVVQNIASQQTQLAGLSGKSLELAQVKLAGLQREQAMRVQSLAKAKAMLIRSEEQLASATNRQEAHKFMAMDHIHQREQARFETAMYSSQDKLNQIEEEMLKAQLASVGAFQTDVKDHRREMRERVAEGQGRIDGLSQYLDAATTATGQRTLGAEVALTSDEQALLDEVMRSVGIEPATTTEDLKSQQAGTTGS